MASRQERRLPPRKMIYTVEVWCPVPSCAWHLREDSRRSTPSVTDRFAVHWEMEHDGDWSLIPKKMQYWSFFTDPRPVDMEKMVKSLKKAMANLGDSGDS